METRMISNTGEVRLGRDYYVGELVSLPLGRVGTRILAEAYINIFDENRSPDESFDIVLKCLNGLFLNVTHSELKRRALN